jgi:hypothetical protein
LLWIFELSPEIVTSPEYSSAFKWLLKSGHKNKLSRVGLQMAKDSELLEYSLLEDCLESLLIKVGKYFYIDKARFSKSQFKRFLELAAHIEIIHVRKSHYSR